jgi:hypothetical protein
MSGVRRAERTLSSFQFYHNAISIHVEVSKLCHSDKVIPKSWRLSHALPLIELSRSLLRNVTKSDAFYPNTTHNVLKRREYLTLAIADCEELGLEFGLLVPMGLTVNMNRFETIANLINDEIALLKGARKGVKLIGKQSLEQQIAGIEEELEVLRAVQSGSVKPC